MLGLVTDRTQLNVERRSVLSRKGWAGMTQDEQNEWTGNPLSVTGANLLPNGPYYSSTLDIGYTLTEILAMAKTAGTYLYAVAIIGNAADYENKVFTLSADEISTIGGGTPQLALYWHDDTGYEYAGGTLLSSGSVTVNTGEWPNINKRANLALYIYRTADEAVEIGTEARFKGVMFELGSVRHEFALYNAIAPTETTKGAYNYSDLNRVERVVKEISDSEGLGLVTKNDWTMWDIPKASDMSRYLSNVKAIQEYAGTSIELPDTMDNLTYEYANNIEKVIEAGLSTASAVMEDF